MSDYAKITLTGIGSKNSDYSNPDFTTANLVVADEFTYDEAMKEKFEAVTSSGTSRSLVYLSSIYRMIIQNLDPTNFVTVVYRSIGGSSTNQTQKILAGGICVLADVDPATALTFTADTASVMVAMTVWST